MRRTRNQKGFTIMELMIVIVIIGILIAIAVPAYNAFRAKANEAACRSNLRSLKSACGLFYAENNADPTEIDDLTDYFENADEMVCPYGGAYTITAGQPTCPNVATYPTHVL